jgi:hypothetical protein
MAAIAFVGAVACGSREPAPARELVEAWTLPDYINAGVPSPDHTWTASEVAKAASVVIAAAAIDPQRLPLDGGSRSGGVFSRLVEVGRDDKLAPAAMVGANTTRDDALYVLMAAYVKAPGEHLPEVCALITAQLHGEAASESQYDSLIAEDAPTDRPAARAKVHELRAGYADKARAVITIASNPQLSIETRRRLLVAASRAFVVLAQRIAPADLTELRVNVATALVDPRLADLHADFSDFDRALLVTSQSPPAPR